MTAWACSTSTGRFRLVRNHEDRNSAGSGTVAVDGNAYDRKGGGTTTLVVNPFTRELERDFISLSGTTVNCAGGITPWESWITCEETNVGPTAGGWTKQHGYNFDVPADGRTARCPRCALTAMGRFSHEAVAVDPDTWIVYETEDNGSTSGFYRFLPTTPGVLANGGTLEMLAIDGQPKYDTRTGQTAGVALPVTWVPIANPNPAGTSSTAVYNQGNALGAARFARLEGCWYGNGAIYFDATSGGNAGVGQIWEFRPEGDGGTLTLIFESPGAAVLDAPDNLAVSPQGAILLCEDGDGDQYMRGVTLDGEIFDFALNLQNDYEWAGATFAEADPSWNDVKIRGNNRPFGSRWDRVTLFVNRQGETTGPNPPCRRRRTDVRDLGALEERGAVVRQRATESQRRRVSPFSLSFRDSVVILTRRLKPALYTAESSCLRGLPAFVVQNAMRCVYFSIRARRVSPGTRVSFQTT